MEWNTDILISIRKLIKLYEAMLKTVCQHYHLTQIETDIISFLQNNPGRDTAGDIVELRMLSKGNVSQAVENLIQKSLLERSQDQDDRRKIHLSLRPEAKPILEEIQRIREKFLEEIFAGFSEQERELYAEWNDRIRNNAKSAMERMD